MRYLEFWVRGQEKIAVIQTCPSSPVQRLPATQCFLVPMVTKHRAGLLLFLEEKGRARFETDVHLPVGS